MPSIQLPQDPARSHIEPDKFLTTNNSISLKTFFLRYSHNLQDCRNNQRRTPTSRLNPSQLKGLANCHQQLQSSPTGKYRQLVSHKLRNTYIGQTPQHPLVQHIGHTPQHPLVNLCNPVLHTTGLIIQYRHRVHAIATRIAPSHLQVHTDNCQTHCHTSHTVHIYTQGHTAHYIRSGL